VDNVPLIALRRAAVTDYLIKVDFIVFCVFGEWSLKHSGKWLRRFVIRAMQT
jgi:hypothetical protein